MKQKKMNKRIVIAGPGAGKTYDMVEEVLKACQNISFNRYCAVITYTNSATDEIRRRLQQKISIPSNLFIGTIHSFLNKFFVLPFSSPLLDIAQDKVFLQTNNDSFGNRGTSVVDRAIKKKRAIEKLNKDGKITYDETINLAEKIIALKQPKVADVISNRIEYLFIDEFQDICTKQIKIFGEILKTSRTHCYIVGDPEQYISWWSSNRISSFLNIPFFKFMKNTKVVPEINHVNRRSSNEIVEFLNNFSNREYPSSGKFHQNSTDDKPLGIPVSFLSITNPEDILKEFLACIARYSLTDKKKMVLAKHKDVAKQFSQLDVWESKDKTSTSLYVLWERMITTAFQRKVSEILSEKNINKIQFRKLVMQVAACYSETENIQEILEKIFNIKPTVKIGKKELKRIDVNIERDEKRCRISHVHSFKGLEAESILMVAKTCEELNLWLETDQNKRDIKQKSELDMVRVGYVGFSRARKFLCITCLENIDQGVKSKLESFKIDIIKKSKVSSNSKDK